MNLMTPKQSKHLVYIVKMENIGQILLIFANIGVLYCHILVGFGFLISKHTKFKVLHK